MWKSKRSVPMTNSERKEMVKRLYGVEDTHILTKVMEFFGFTFDAPLRWDKIGIIALLHIATFWTIWNTGLNLTKFKLASIIWGVFIGLGSGFGYTGGAHRLWSHKAYKAKTPLKVLLMFFWTITGQQTLYEWARDHRIHHKFNETDSDPFDVHRGMFFAHFGFNMMHRHPNALDKEKKLDFSDITDEPVVQFEIKYHNVLKCLMAFIIPFLVPVYCWNEQWSKAFTVVMVRYMIQQHLIWSGNSVAHGIGNKPYDKRTLAVENKIFAILTMGEGWHNYHHAFAWDYKTSELGFYKYNLSTMFIDFFASIGWAYDLRTASKEMIEKTVAKTGDGTHERAKEIATKYPSQNK